MAQYKEGTVSITNGSASVTGTGTTWLGQFSAGAIFSIKGDGVYYDVAAVVSNTQLTLSAPYGGVSNAAAVYSVVRDFTANLSLPIPEPGDIDVAAMVKRAFATIDTRLGHTLQDLIFKDYREVIQAPSSSTGTLTIDMDDGNVIEVMLTENVTMLDINNVDSDDLVSISLIVKQDATGGRTMTWPASFTWPNGAAEALSTASNAIDVFTIMTSDGGTTWLAFLAGKGMS